MDLRLPLLADVNLHLGVAEEALADNAYYTARREWEKASLAFEELEKEWPTDEREEGLFLAMYNPLFERFENIKKELPKESLVEEIEDDEKKELEAEDREIESSLKNLEE